MSKLKEKRGSSLLEVVLSVALLAIVVVTVVGGIALAQQSVSTNNTKDNYAAQAQNVADTLVTYLSAKDDKLTQTELTTAMTAIDGKTLCVNDATNPGVFNWAPTDKKNKQYSYQYVKETTTQSAGYHIEVRVYYDGGNIHSTITAFAAYTGGAFQ